MKRNCPILPNLSRTNSRGNRPETATDIDRITPVGPEYQCREELHEFVDQKREIYLIQLLIDGKKKD
jgi:hypothetical protein